MKTYNNCWITIQGNGFTTMFIYSSKKTENNGFYDYYNLSKSHQKQEITRPKTFLRRKLFISFRLLCIVTNKYLNPKHRLSIYLRIEDLTYVFVCSGQRLLLMQKGTMYTNKNEMNHGSLNILIQRSIKYFQAQLGLSKQLFFAFVSYFLQSLTNICHKTHQ